MLTPTRYTTTIDSVLPTCAMKRFALEVLVLFLTTVTPITRDHCRIDVVACEPFPLDALLAPGC